MRWKIWLLVPLVSCGNDCPAGSYTTPAEAEAAAARECWLTGGEMTEPTSVMQNAQGCFVVVASGCRAGVGVGAGPGDALEILSFPL